MKISEGIKIKKLKTENDKISTTFTRRKFKLLQCIVVNISDQFSLYDIAYKIDKMLEKLKVMNQIFKETPSFNYDKIFKKLKNEFLTEEESLPIDMKEKGKMINKSVSEQIGKFLYQP